MSGGGDETQQQRGPGALVRLADLEVPLAPGEELTFGRTLEEEVPGHLGLGPDPALHAHAGTVLVDDAGVAVVNTGRWLRLRLSSVDGAGSVEAEPGATVRVPWPDCRVEIVTGAGSVGFGISTTGGGPAGDREPVRFGDTVQALNLDRDSGYFRALVALCEPRLRDPASEEVASAARIALRLRVAEGVPVTVKAVERRLAHLRQRVGIGGADPHGVSAAGLEVRDATRRVADLALRTGTVTPADLALLDPPRQPR